MKKRVEKGDLKIGMIIVELDRPWLDTPFLFQHFTITNAEDLAMVQSLCDYVYIDDDPAAGEAAKRRPVMASFSKPLTSSRGTGATGMTIDVNMQVPAALHSDSTVIPRYTDVVSVEEELQKVIELESVVREAIFTIFDDARQGRAINVENTRKLVAEVVESAIRNPDALAWITQLKKKHEYTATHGLRVCMVAVMLGRHLGYDREKLNLLGTGSLLLDIGKIRIPDEILNKTTALTPTEYELMKTHVLEGVKLLSTSSSMPQEVLDVVARHHEHYDGSGYVTGMSGDSIGELAMITAIVDTYDAILSDRNFQKAISNVEAMREIYKLRGSHYHPWLTEQFIQCMGIYPVGSIVEMTNGEVGVVIAINRIRRLRPRVTLIRSASGAPLRPPKDVDLMFSCDTKRQPYDIRKMLPTGTFDINPIDYLPIKH